MNYEKIYNQLIERAQSENRQKGCGIYFERHHIVPKCIGGTNSKDNLILLTAREHYVAHKLLCEIYPDNDKLHYALWRMMNPQTKTHIRNYNISSREYDHHRQIHQEKIQKLGLSNKGKKHSVPRSDEHKKKIGLAHIGKKISPDVIAKISAANRGLKRTPETIEKLKCKRPGTSEKLKGRKQDPEVIRNRVLKNTGQKRSDEVKLKISLSTKGKPKNRKNK